MSSACLQKAGSVETLSVPECGRAAPALTVLGGLSEALAVPLRLYDNERPAITATFKRRQRFSGQMSHAEYAAFLARLLGLLYSMVAIEPRTRHSDTRLRNLFAS
ncbi:hypothetical protein [Denitrobaculum tricleocarpae]|uniref:Uncharacterized protein n=1 Tax=Denitrobaculum tricleocarpae TaxID=2591009 RepID=A0A545TKH2_9PROT|nr:hypothetical protein [Denitrobaculum tricleocarpae]TQV77707.1 hypothetical protein FKG95_19270 [Denitrobaculum tricleocarpae]